MKTFIITTEQLFRNFTGNYTDMFWDDPASIYSIRDTFMDNLRDIAIEDMEAIRKLFKAGYTPLLVGSSVMEQLDNVTTGEPQVATFVKDTEEREIRVFSSRKEGNPLLGVIIDSEIVF